MTLSMVVFFAIAASSAVFWARKEGPPRTAKIVFLMAMSPVLLFEIVAFYLVFMGITTHDKQYMFADMAAGLATIVLFIWTVILLAAYHLGAWLAADRQS